MCVSGPAAIRAAAPAGRDGSPADPVIGRTADIRPPRAAYGLAYAALAGPPAASGWCVWLLANILRRGGKGQVNGRYAGERDALCTAGPTALAAAWLAGEATCYDRTGGAHLHLAADRPPRARRGRHVDRARQ